LKPHEILIRPLITEKSTIAQEEGKYVFQVSLKAGKGEIKEAVERSFGVKVVGVNTTKSRGKVKRFGPRMTRKADVKKAVVTLRRGDRIQIIEGI
jgi:large subunit ribosomal protein L23